MTPEARVYQALSGGKPDRAPTLPKIWLNLAASIQDVPIEQVAGDPAVGMQTVVEAALTVNADAARLFHVPPRRLERRAGHVVELDAHGAVRGPIDLQGGLATHLLDGQSRDLSDPVAVAFAQFWSADQPMLHDLAHVDQIAIPDVSFYETHFGVIQRQVSRQFGHRIALIGDCGSASLAFYVALRGMEAAMIDLVDNPAVVQRVMEIAAEVAIQKGKFNIDCGLRLLRLNDSVANMSVISPDTWRNFVKPCFTRVCDELHAYRPDVRIYCHVCGNTLPVLEDLVETGLDGIGPLDPLGRLTCAQARRVVGQRVALVGGVNTLTFVNGTPQQVIDEARTCIEEAGRDGGFIVGSGCALPRDSRVENLRALAAAAFLCGSGSHH